MSKNLKLWETGQSYDRKGFRSDNQGQNISDKVKQSSEIGQNRKRFNVHF